ncbi:MAG: low molecular weight phosphatase family protein [Parvularculaceae bacterium]
MTKSVLFACNMNSVRSPMAAALLRAAAGDRLAVDSAGLYEGGLDPFAEAVMAEIGVPMGDHAPKRLAALDARAFDVMVALTAEAAEEVRRLAPEKRIEFWPIENPSQEEGGREEVIAAYRRARDAIREKLVARFPEFFEKP